MHVSNTKQHGKPTEKKRKRHTIIFKYKTAWKTNREKKEKTHNNIQIQNSMENQKRKKGKDTQ